MSALLPAPRHFCGSFTGLSNSACPKRNSQAAPDTVPQATCSVDSSALLPGHPSVPPAPSVLAAALAGTHPTLVQRPLHLHLPPARPRPLLSGPAYPGHRAQGPGDFWEPEDMFSFPLKPEENSECNNHESVTVHPAWMTPDCTPNTVVKYLNSHMARKGPVKATATLRSAVLPAGRGGFRSRPDPTAAFDTCRPVAPR